MKTAMLSAVIVMIGLAGAYAAEPTPPNGATLSESERVYLLHDYLFVDGEALYSTVQAVIDKLLAKQPGAYPRPKLLIYSAESFSASADMDGNLLISTQTLRKLDSEDELAALLGHELAHLVKKHPAKKNFMQRFPVGADTYAAIIAAGERIRQQRAGAQKPDEQNKKRLAHSQNVSLFWSDILAPSWNRKDEREADLMGLEMMQAAGYDPRAVVTLISKLADASVQRSARMQALCEELIAQEQKKPRIQTSSDNVITQVAAEEADQVRGAGTEKLIRKGFDELLQFSAPYSSTDERIEQIKQEYAGGSRDMIASKKLGYRKAEKDNGELLNLDERAIAGLKALNSGDTAAANSALGEVLKAKPASPHFKLATSAYYEAQNDPAKSDAHIAEWIASTRAPLIAFMLHADYQSSQKAFTAAMATFNEGRARLDSPVPFLPPMITVAKLNKDEVMAEQLTLECKTVANRNTLSRITNVATKVTGNGQPTGLYLECIERLGRWPEGERPGEGGWLSGFKK